MTHTNHGSSFEGGHRVPFVMRYDGVLPSGERRNNLIGLNDVFATIAEFSGADIPDRSAQDSVSFAQHAISEDNVSRRKKLGTWDFFDGKLQAESLRFGAYKYIKHYSQPKKHELFNLQNDIKEENGLEPLDLSLQKAKNEENWNISIDLTLKKVDKEKETKGEFICFCYSQCGSHRR